MTHDRWRQLRGVALIAYGKDYVTERLEGLGCTVTRASNPVDGRLSVRTAGGRALEVFVSTQRVGGYAFWTKRRLQPSGDRFAVLVVLAEASEPDVFLVPSTDWVAAAPPLTDRDYVGRKSEPEYGIELAPAALPLLQRYAWTDAKAKRAFT
jgi:hypothetical protein